MNAPLIWIVFPFVFAGVLWLLQGRPRLAAVLAVVVCAVLGLLAYFVEIGGVVRLGPIGFQIGSTLVVFGRKFALLAEDRFLLVLVFGLGAFWFAGSLAANTHRFFPSLGMGLIALLVAAMAVEPFLYAALLVEVAVLLTIPLFVPPGQTAGQGVLRYLIFQTLALPFILLAGWVLGGTAISPGNENRLLQAALLLALGFAFWLAVFPFHTWVPMLVSESHPYVVGFVLTLLSTVVLILALDFLNGLAWLRNLALTIPVLRLAGILMVVTGGVWAAFQEDLNRLFGYAVIIEVGLSLIGLSLYSQGGLAMFAAALLPRFIEFALWALALSLLRSAEIPATLQGISGLVRTRPVVCAALMVAAFSTGGLPLLAGFPARQALMEALAKDSLPQLVWVLIGSIGFLFACVRMLASSLSGKIGGWKLSETTGQIALLTGGIAALIIIGLLPQIFLSGLVGLLAGFPFLQ